MCSQCEGLRGADVEACIPKRSRYLEMLFNYDTFAVPRYLYRISKHRMYVWLKAQAE